MRRHNFTSNKNTRIIELEFGSIQFFGMKVKTRILIFYWDVKCPRGLDLDEISMLINFDTPTFPLRNYMHRNR